MKKLPIEERKVSTTFALSLKALEKLDEIQRLYPGKSRSYAVEQIICRFHDIWIMDPKPILEESPDDFRDIRDNPFIGMCEEDL